MFGLVNVDCLDRGMKAWIPVETFSRTNRVVHHLSAVLFIGALFLMAYDQIFGSTDALMVHQSLGVMVFVLYFGRIVLMAWFGKPKAIGTRFEQFLAHLAHLALYSVLILMPLSGLSLNIAGGEETAIFGLLTIPSFDEVNLDVYLLMLGFHKSMQWVCYMLLSAHIGASVFHHFVLKDATLKRMFGAIK